MMSNKFSRPAEGYPSSYTERAWRLKLVRRN